MITSYCIDELKRLAPDELGDALERGEIVHFPCPPIELPGEADLRFLRVWAIRSAFPERYARFRRAAAGLPQATLAPYRILSAA